MHLNYFPFYVLDIFYHLKTYSEEQDRAVSFYLHELSNRAILKEKGGLICMMYTTQYTSPLGNMLLAADAIGLTGAWFEGQKYFSRSLDAEHQERETSVLTDTKRWLDLYFRGMQPIFCRHCTRLDRRFSSLSGRFYYRFPTDIQPRMEKLHDKLPRSKGFPVCLRRRSAVLSGITRFLFSSPVIALSAQTEV